MITFIVLVTALAVVPPLEARFGPPGRPRRRRANVALMPFVFATSAVVGILEATSLDIVDERSFGLIPWLGLDGLAAWAVALAGLDLAGYAGHRLRHRVGLLWSFHRTHHTDSEVDVTTTLRHHPLDVVALVATSAIALLALGCSAAHLAGFGLLGAVVGMWDHVRFRLPLRLERALGLLIQTPGLHRMHHSPDRQQTDSNFGLVLTLWDRLFGTFRPVVDHGPVGLDTIDLAARQSLRAMLIEPWRPLVHPAATDTPAPTEHGRREAVGSASS